MSAGPGRAVPGSDPARSSEAAVGVLGRPSLAQLLVAPLWLYLIVRWTYDWVLAPGQNVSARVSLLPLEAVSETARWLDRAGEPGLLAAVSTWAAGGVEFLAFGLESLPQLAAGAWLTILLTVSAILLGFVLAVPLAVVRVYGNRPLRWLSLSITELLRGTPLLAQLFVLYYGLSLTRYLGAISAIGWGLIPGTAVFVAVIGFTINSAAYQAEYIRSALQGLDAGQLTAARAVGLSKLAGIRHVVLPQGLRFAIPGWSNELVYLIKYSSLASFITVGDLFFRARSIGSDSYRYLEIYAIAGLFYILLVLSASMLMERVETRTAIPGLGTTGDR